MAISADKIIITNISALKKKYGSSGLDDVKKAIDGLISADKERGLVTLLVPIDDQSAMGALSGTPVRKATDPAQNKQAIDEVYRALVPDYIVILGSIDVVPHQDLKNLVYGSGGEDDDKFAYGDLPYACEAPYSQNIKDFIGPTRVVGRVPDITGGNDPSYLINLLSVATHYRQVPAQALQDNFCVTAEIWSRSTELSANNTFGASANLQSVPPKNYKWDDPQLGKPVHFFNCHGAPSSSQFYGQPKSGEQAYPCALDAAFIDGKIKEGTVTAAECCYGAELYPLSSTEKQIGICSVYLGNKAYGFFGSTTIAYGPDQGNGQADLICQYFLQDVIHGASLGRAALQARQEFIRKSSPADPTDLKTLAQFNLLGDPSVTPAATPKAFKAMPQQNNELAARSERKDRRLVLYRSGLDIVAKEPVPVRSDKKMPKLILEQLEASAREEGHEPGSALSFVVQHGKGSRIIRAMSRSVGRLSGYHILFAKSKGKKRAKRQRESEVVDIVAFIGKEVDGKLISVWKIRSR
jgi:hypothetical protein